MIGVICAAGKGTRMSETLEHFGVKSKCLLPFANQRIIDIQIAEMRKAGAEHIVLVASEDNKEELQQAVKNVEVKSQGVGPAGTATAVMSAAGHTVAETTMLVAWSDMLFKLPPFPKSGQWTDTVFTAGISQSRSDRFEGCVCSGDRVLAISARNVPKQGPFLMTTGVYLFTRLRALNAAYVKLAYGCDATLELPIELVLQAMINDGVPFKADCLDLYLDLGTAEAYEGAVMFMNGDKK